MKWYRLEKRAYGCSASLSQLALEPFAPGGQWRRSRVVGERQYPNKDQPRGVGAVHGGIKEHRRLSKMRRRPSAPRWMDRESSRSGFGMALDYHGLEQSTRRVARHER